MNQTLVALYELKRQSFLNGYIQNPDRFCDALAYAYYHRVAPIFHEEVAREKHGGDPFADVYAVKASFVDEVTKYMDDCWLANKLTEIGFYVLEEKFGGYKTNRVELIRALEYTRIAGRFDDDVWHAIESNAPTEANSLAAIFTPKDVYFD